MLSISDELKTFKPKTINTYKESINDLYQPLHSVENKLGTIDKISKKTFLFTDMLKDQLEEKDKEIFKLKRKQEDMGLSEEKLLKKFLNVLDHFDNIYKYAIESKDIELEKNLDISIKLIKKDLMEVGINEIPSLGEIFSPELHDCIKEVEDSERHQYEIIQVIKKGYTYKGKVIRLALVVVAK